MTKWLTLVVDADQLTTDELQALTEQDAVRQLAWGNKLAELKAQVAAGTTKELQLARQAELLREGDQSFQDQCRQRFLRVLGSRGQAKTAF